MPDHRGAGAVPSRARRRGRSLRRAVLLVLAGATAWAAFGTPLGQLLPAPEAAAGTTTTGAVVPPAAAATAPATVGPAPSPTPSPTPTLPTTPLMARRGDVVLHLPAEDAVLVAYHEASTIRSQRLRPLGELVGNDNATRFDDPGAVEDGSPYVVQVSRGRSAAATSAVDVVLREREPVLAPVAARVVEVREYFLYGRHPDVRIELRPHGQPDTAVVLIHVEDPRVRAGEDVEVGQPLAGGARRFGFHSVVDNLTAPALHGHVHLEVKPAEVAAADVDGDPTS